MLPIDTRLGQLEIFEVYEYMDGPRLFAARNNIGTMFLVFWCDELENATGWLYLPISEAKLSRLRRKKLSLNAAFTEPETDYYLVYTGIPPQPDSAEFVSSNDIDVDYFPPEDYYIEYVDVVNIQTDGWSFETILSGAKTSAEGLSQFIGRFRELTEDIMRRLAGRKLHLYPQSATTGSIRIKFSADSNDEAIESLKIVNQLFQSNSKEEFQKYIIENRINTSQLQDFLSSILRNNISVEIVPKLASDGDGFKLPVEIIEQFMGYLNDIDNIIVDSIKIPQANDIDKVLEVLKMMNDGKPLIHENVDGITSERQVRYYTDAAFAYGLATKDRQLTAAGHFVISHDDKEIQYKILADRFESTDFGWAWMKWAKVKYMTDLDPETAADFIKTSVPGLSEDTAGRRSSTLKKWLTKLQPHHRKYEPE